MKSVICALFLAASFNSMAKNVTCVLSSGSEKSLATIKISDLDQEGNGFAYSEGAMFDLSFSMELSCNQTACETLIVVNSGILEDEAGSSGFDFDLDKTPFGKIHSEPVTHAPDGKNYFLYCYLNK